VRRACELGIVFGGVVGGNGSGLEVRHINVRCIIVYLTEAGL